MYLRMSSYAHVHPSPFLLIGIIKAIHIPLISSWAYEQPLCKIVSKMGIFATFLVAVAAGVACHIICKWLDGDK